MRKISIVHIDVQKSLMNLFEVITKTGADYIETNAKVATLLMDSAIYTELPEITILDTAYRVGYLGSISISVNPLMTWGNNTIFLHKEGEYVENIEIEDIDKLF